ncbi:MAG: hypothetical protein ACLTAS_07350 [Butyribacter sp.]
MRPTNVLLSPNQTRKPRCSRMCPDAKAALSTKKGILERNLYGSSVVTVGGL